MTARKTAGKTAREIKECKKESNKQRIIEGKRNSKNIEHERQEVRQHEKGKKDIKKYIE